MVHASHCLNQIYKYRVLYCISYDTDQLTIQAKI